MTDPIRFPLRPYNLSLGLGYNRLQLRDDLTHYNGFVAEAIMGKNFELNTRNTLSLNGVFRYGNYENQATASALHHFFGGINAEYSLDIIQSIFGVFLDAELGLGYFASDTGLHTGQSSLRNLQNGLAFTFGLGVGFGFWNNAFRASAFWHLHNNISIEGGSPADSPIGLTPHSFSFFVSADLARIQQNLSSVHTPRRRNTSNETQDSAEEPDYLQDSEGLEEWFSQLQNPHGLLFADFGFNPDPSYQLVEGRIFLQKQSSPSSPLGFGLNFALSYGNGSPAGLAGPPEHGGFSPEFEEAFLSLYFPGLKTTFTLGRHFMANQMVSSSDNDAFFTTSSLQNHESPMNLQIEHSYLFHYGSPLSFGGFSMQKFIDPHTLFTAMTLHDWDHLSGNSVGHGGMLNISAHNPDWLATGFSLMAGKSQNSAYFLFNAQALMCLPATSNCSLINPNTRFNAGIEYLFGTDENGTWQGADLMARVNFNPHFGFSSRFSFFYDPAGVRTGAAQTLLESSATLHVQPLAWIRLKAEYRRGESLEAQNLFSPFHIPSSNTFQTGAALVF